MDHNTLLAKGSEPQPLIYMETGLQKLSFKIHIDRLCKRNIICLYFLINPTELIMIHFIRETLM